MGDRKDVEQVVKKIVAAQLQCKVKDLTTTVKLTDLGACRLDYVELAMDLEEEFTMNIADMDFENLTTVGEMVDYINKYS